MRRVLSTLSWELRIQARQGIYLAAAFIVIVWAAMLAQLPRPAWSCCCPSQCLWTCP